MPTYFFKPYIGHNYEDGFLGSKTLVVGAHHYCPFECEYKEECLVDSRPFDSCCPEFEKTIGKFGEEWREYYTLSNDNKVEIDCYIEGAPYPAYSAFTKYMLGTPDYLTKEQKQNFWDSVVFYQYTQHFLPDGYTPSYLDEKEMFDKDYASFREAIEELGPEIILVWNPAVRDCILANEKECKSLVYKGRADMQALSLFVFVSAEYEMVKKKKGIFSAKHIKITPDEFCPEFHVERKKESWFVKQVKDIVGVDITLDRCVYYRKRTPGAKMSYVLYQAYLAKLLSPGTRGFIKPDTYNGYHYGARNWGYFKTKLHDLFKINNKGRMPTGKMYEELLNEPNINSNIPKKEKKEEEKNKKKNEINKAIDAFFAQFTK